jgi:hypothetical protein
MPYLLPTHVHRAELYRQADAWGVNFHFKKDKLPFSLPPIFGTPSNDPFDSRADAIDFGVRIAMILLMNETLRRAG